MKRAILLLGRGKILKDYMQGMINTFSKEYAVLVIDDINIKYKNEHIRLNAEFNQARDSIDYNKLYNAEKEIGLNLYDAYSNYFYYFIY